MPETAEWMQIDAAVAAEEARAQAQAPVEPTRVRVRVRVEADAASAAEHTEALQALWALDEAAAQDDAEKQGAVEEAAAEAEFTARYGVDQQVELAEDARREHAAARVRWMRQVWAAVAIDTALVETVLRQADALPPVVGRWGQEAAAWAQHQEPAAVCCGWVADSQCTGCGAPAEDPTQRNFYFGPVPGWRSIAAYCAAAHTPPAFALLCVGCAGAAASATAYDGGGSGYPGHDGAPLCARSSLFMANHGELTCSCCDPRGQRRAAAVEAVHARALAAHAARQARRAARRSSFVLEAGEALVHAARAAATAAGQTVREARRAEAAATAAAGALAAAVQAAELPPEAGAHRLSPRRM